MTQLNYYQLLGLTPDTATAEDIKVNYRKLAMRWHPDHNPGDKTAEETFKRITEAYEVLSDSEKKAEYDRKNNFADATFDFKPFFGFSFTDYPMRGRWESWPGADISIAIEISFLQSLRGVKDYPLHITRECDCPQCKGKGAEKADLCERCAGSGRVVDHRTMLPQDCPTCGGLGAKLTNVCETCSGLGRLLVSDEIKIDIPCGVNNGSILRTPSVGHGSHLSGPNGDVYSTIHIKNDSPYRREQQTLILKMKVPPETLILGGSIDVPLPLGGTQKQTIPPCCSNNWSFAIAGHGVPAIGNPNRRGMLLVVLEAEFPDKISDEEERLLKEYAEIRKKSKDAGFDPSGC